MLIDRYNLRDALYEYSKSYSMFGTCAGMIMLSNTKNLENNVNPLNIMNFSVSRNSWGSQVYSFEQKVNLKNFNIRSFNAIFIRAPKVTLIGKGIKIGYIEENEPIILEDGNHIACSFHPELNEDTRLHEYFLNKFYHEK